MSTIKARREWSPGSKIDFVWMPAGRSVITASWGHGDKNKPIRLAVLCDEAGAAAVKAGFADLVKRNSRRPPFICAEHRAKEKVAKPIDFNWGKVVASNGESQEGIICTCEPTAHGASLVNGETFTSFSPTFATDADYSQLKEVAGVWMFPEGVRGSESNPARVTGTDEQSCGSVTNWNAFRDILPIAAREPSVKASGTSEGAKIGWANRPSHGFVSLDSDGEAHVKPFHNESDAWAEHSLAKSIGGPKRIALMKFSSDETHESIKDKVSKAWPEANRVHVHDDAVEIPLAKMKAKASEPSTASSILARLAPATASETAADVLARLTVKASGTIEGAIKAWETKHLDAGGKYTGEDLSRFGFNRKPGTHIPITERYSAMAEHNQATTAKRIHERSTAAEPLSSTSILARLSQSGRPQPATTK